MVSVSPPRRGRGRFETTDHVRWAIHGCRYFGRFRSDDGGISRPKCEVLSGGRGLLAIAAATRRLPSRLRQTGRRSERQERAEGFAAALRPLIRPRRVGEYAAARQFRHEHHPRRPQLSFLTLVQLTSFADR